MGGFGFFWVGGQFSGLEQLSSEGSYRPFIRKRAMGASWETTHLLTAHLCMAFS